MHLPTGKTMAVKIITPEEDEIPEDLMIEIAVLKQCKHKNIVEFFGGYRKGDEIFVSLSTTKRCLHFFINHFSELTSNEVFYL